MTTLRPLPESTEKGLLQSDRISEQAKILLKEIFAIRDFIRTMITLIEQHYPDASFMRLAGNLEYLLYPWGLVDDMKNICYGNRSQEITALSENGITLQTTEVPNPKETRQETIEITPSSFRLERNHSSKPFFGRPATLRTDSGWIDPQQQIDSTGTVLDIQHIPLMADHGSLSGTTASVARVFGEGEILSVDDPSGSLLEDLLEKFHANLLETANKLLVELQTMAAPSIPAQTIPSLDVPRRPWWEA